MKDKTATFVGYTFDASYYINGDPTSYDYYNTPNDKAGDVYEANADAVYDEIKAIYGPNARIVSCGDETFFGTPDYGSQLKGDCVEYSILY